MGNINWCAVIKLKNSVDCFKSVEISHSFYDKQGGKKKTWEFHSQCDYI